MLLTRTEDIIKYLCLVFSDEETRFSLPDRPKDGECMAHAEGLKQSGCLIDGHPLGATATTVRMRDGRLSVTDGPFAETKEQLAGLCMIDVANLDEAIKGPPPSRQRGWAVSRSDPFANWRSE